VKRRILELSALSWLAVAAACSESSSPAQGPANPGAGQAGLGANTSSTGGSAAAAANGGGTAGNTVAGAAGGGAVSATAGSAGSGGGADEPDGFAQLERLDRGLVALPHDDGIYVGWRLFGYDPESIAFDLYRDGVKVNAEPIVGSTNYVDAAGTAQSTYRVRALVGGLEAAESEAVAVWSPGFLEIPTIAPEGGTTPAGEGYSYTSGDGSAGDVDGDGRYELVVKWDPSNAKDNSQSGYTGNVFVDAYDLDGQRLWRIDLGVNIRAGAHYTQFLVYDLDGDGKAEVVMKTAPGTRDGSGAYLHTGPASADDDEADYRCSNPPDDICASNRQGYVLTGPEYLTVFAGDTGAELASEDFEVGRGEVSDWGDSYGNRVDRLLATIAFVDDTGRPSAIMGRGMYTRTTFTAWNWRDGVLSQIWTADHPSSGEFAGKGAHSISVANVDDDPQQEIVNGAATFDHDGSGICALDWYGHGDALHVSDLVPSRPGLEVFMPFEAAEVPLYAMRDARTCEILWQGTDTPSGGEGPGRGVAGDVDPESEGAEAWVSGDSRLRGESGEPYADKPGADNFLIWWDGDLSRELLNGTTVSQVDGEGEGFSAEGCSANNGTKSVPTLSADLIGDWREEVVFRCGESLRIYSTRQVSNDRLYTLMHDPQYRVAISWQNVEYNQPPHPSFHVGQGMAAPPLPDLHLP
jgi:rhamnogalacturonan endolyase